jgi:hypothetical protein
MTQDKKEIERIKSLKIKSLNVWEYIYKFDKQEKGDTKKIK